MQISFVRKIPRTDLEIPHESGILFQFKQTGSEEQEKGSVDGFTSDLTADCGTISSLISSLRLREPTYIMKGSAQMTPRWLSRDTKPAEDPPSKGLAQWYRCG